MFESISSNLPETISTQWLFLLAILAVGLKVGVKGFSYLKQASTGMLVAAVLFMSGLGSTGFSIGDLAAGWGTETNPTVEEQLQDGGFSNEELLALMKESPNIDAEQIKMLLDYAAVRDSQAVVVVNEEGAVVKVHALPNQLIKQDNEKVQFVSHGSNGKGVPVAPASLTTEVEATETVSSGRRLPIQWLMTMLFGGIAALVVSVIVAGRTANANAKAKA